MPEEAASIVPWLRLSMRMPLQGPSGRFELDVALEAERGAFVAVTGPSGAGKTTLMRLVAGLARPAEGRLSVGGQRWCDTSGRVELPTRRRSIGYVFQDYALFPNMSVRGNVEFAAGRRRDRAWIDELLRLSGLYGLRDQRPDWLSGGQRQRLALIRALARRPAILLLDEPLSALDPPLRRELQNEVLRLHRHFGTTTFMVSHDPAEMLRMADRLLRLDAGHVTFDGAPLVACGSDAAGRGLGVVAEHMEGPDAEGWSSVLVDGRLRRVRYRDRDARLPSAAPVLLSADEVRVDALAAAPGLGGSRQGDLAGVPAAGD